MRGFARGHSGGENKRPERTISHGEIDPQEWVSLNFIDQCRFGFTAVIQILTKQ